MVRNELSEALASLRIERGSEPRPAAPPARPRWWPLAAGAVALAAAVLAWWAGTRPARSDPRLVTAARPMVEGVGGTAAGTVLSASGWIVASREAVISPGVAGRVVEFRYAEGERVRAGDVLARLDDREAVAQLERARAGLARARALLDEQRRLKAVGERLADAGAMARSEVDAVRSRLALAEAEARVAQADVTVAQAAVDHCAVLAPFDGVLVRKLVEPGETVAPTAVPRDAEGVGGAVATIADVSALEVEVDVNEMHLDRVRVGQRAEVEVAARPGQRTPAVVVRVTPVADRSKGTITVRARLTEQDPALRPQLSAKVSFLPDDAGRAERAVYIPRHALAAGGGARVFAVREGKVLPIELTLGASRGDRVQVTSGLAGDEVLVANPPPDLAVGETVEVKP